MNTCSRRLGLVALLLIGSTAVSRTAHAADILFFGNSFTSVSDVPKLVESVAVSKGKKIGIQAVTKGGQGFPYHLGQPATDKALEAKAWNWVVLQDQSLNATRARAEKGDDFLKTGEQFYQRVADKSPAANVILYETWAYAPKHGVFAAKDGKKGVFTGPDEMVGEIRKNYGALQVALQAKDAKRKVVVAPVGTAFADCARKHPELNLYAADNKHQNLAGSYLAALVIYSVAFDDSPVGAAVPPKLDPNEAKLLQQVAEETVKAARTAKKADR